MVGVQGQTLQEQELSMKNPLQLFGAPPLKSGRQIRKLWAMEEEVLQKYHGQRKSTIESLYSFQYIHTHDQEDPKEHRGS